MKSLIARIRNRGVRVVSCPSCARQGFDVIRTVQALEERLQHIKTPMSLSVLGCVVNGPGEARETDIASPAAARASIWSIGGVTDHHVADAVIVDHIRPPDRGQGGRIDAGAAPQAAE